jgi:hypothetical protein
MENQDYISLYDFLGTPAGSELGKDVYAAAWATNTPTKKREVQNKKYTGKINLYPELFLQGYFAAKNRYEKSTNKEHDSSFQNVLPF